MENGCVFFVYIFLSPSFEMWNFRMEKKIQKAVKPGRISWFDNRIIWARVVMWVGKGKKIPPLSYSSF